MAKSRAKAKSKAKSRAKTKGKARRTTHRSGGGSKLYAARSSRGRFADVQTFERAHERDIKQLAQDEVPARRRRAAKKKK